MNYVEEVARDSRQVGINIPDLFARELVSSTNQGKIRGLIRSRWLLGRKPDGTLIGVYAWRSYADKKYQQNPLAGLDRVDLTLTGSLGRGIKVSYFGGTEFEIFSTDEKFDKIVEMFGEENFNLSDEESAPLFAAITEVVINKMLEQVYG